MKQNSEWKKYSELDLKGFSALAVELAKCLKSGDVVLFEGEMGAGKTFFIKCALDFFGVADVTSPTFSIINYHQNDAGMKFYHLDLHRLNPESNEIDYIGIDDVINVNGIVFIEWSDYYKEYFEANGIGDYRVRIELSKSNVESRDVEVSRVV